MHGNDTCYMLKYVKMYKFTKFKPWQENSIMNSSLPNITERILASPLISLRPGLSETGTSPGSACVKPPNQVSAEDQSLSEAASILVADPQKEHLQNLLFSEPSNRSPRYRLFFQCLQNSDGPCRLSQMSHFRASVLTSTLHLMPTLNLAASSGLTQICPQAYK